MITINTNDNDFSSNYKLLIGGVLPRPIAAVSTLNLDGSNNLAPFSFFTGVSAKPLILAICPLVRTSDLSQKDTTKNILREKEFVINIVSFQIAEQINNCSSELKYGEDEFKFSKLTPIESETIRAKRIKESLIHYECVLKDYISYGDHAGAGNLITGEVKRVHIAEAIYEDGKINAKNLDPVARGSGNDWLKYSDTFEMQRHMKAQIQK